ncbi:MAG: hypothetical protein LBP95_12160 [Deltaproteobacteria bacterium]|jgi:hypothetical protein|nr:hypothetical protein [Deltaproteobacteria bacterium]
MEDDITHTFETGKSGKRWRADGSGLMSPERLDAAGTPPAAPTASIVPEGTRGSLPWSGPGFDLGAEAGSVSPLEGTRLGGLDWTVRKQPVFLGDGSPVEGHFAVVRQDLGLALGLVGRFYECHQNAELFSFMDGFCRLSGRARSRLGPSRVPAPLAAGPGATAGGSFEPGLLER